MVNAKGQYKIQQMAFMIVAVFIFFVLVGLFFFRWQFSDLQDDFDLLEREQAISSLEVISDMSEFNCGARESLCLDEDKIKVMSSAEFSSYKEVLGVDSLKVYSVYPEKEEFVVFDSSRDLKEYSTFVSVCKKKSSEGFVYDDCVLGKLVVGVEVRDE